MKKEEERKSLIAKGNSPQSSRISGEITFKFEGQEIIERVASKFGTGCHVIIPKEYAGRKVKIILCEDNEINLSKKPRKGGKK